MTDITKVKNSELKAFIYICGNKKKQHKKDMMIINK